MRKNKKILASLLAVLMVVSLLPVSAFADGDGGDGDGDPVLIEVNQIRDEDKEVSVYDGEQFVADADLSAAQSIEGDVSPVAATEDFDPAVQVIATSQDTSFTVDGNVNMATEGGLNDAVEVYADGADASVAVTGDVTALSAEEANDTYHVAATAAGLDAYDGEATFTADGNVKSDASYSGNEEYVSAYSTAIGVNTDGGSAVVDTSKNVGATAFTSSDGGSAVAMGIVINAWSGDNIISVDGDISANAEATAEYGYANASGVSAKVDGEDEPASVDIMIGGNVSVSTKQQVDGEYTGAVAVEGNAFDGGKLNVDVAGTVTAESDEPWNQPVAASIQAIGEGSEAYATIGKGANGILYANASDGAEAGIRVLEGGVNASTGYNGAAYVSSDGEGSSSIIDIVGDIVATNAENMPLMAIGGIVWAADGGNSKFFVDGDVSASADVECDWDGAVTLAGGLQYQNEGGYIDSYITGDVTATSAMKNFGLAVEAVESDECDTNIIIDGTVSAADYGVVLLSPETEIGNNVSLTVWEIVPNEDGAVVGTLVNENTYEVEENEEAEKAVQYIVRVKAGQEDIISTEGTKQYRMMDVANEGDLITLKLNIPEGYKVVEAYSDVAQETTLEKDDSGNYFLTMPRGGAVELSVKLEEVTSNGNSGNQENQSADNNNTGKDDGKTDDKDKNNSKTDKDSSSSESKQATEKKDNEVKVLLTVKDKDGKISIKFTSDGKFEAKMEDGSIEKGTFKFVDGKLVLKLGVNEIKADEENKFIYVSDKDPNKTYDFELKPNEIAALKV